MKSVQPTIGILGGGQLARMMSLKAHEIGIPVKVLSDSKDDPAAQVTSDWVKGSPLKTSQLEKFLQSVDIATFESEFLDAELLHKISRKTKTKIFPEPQTMGKLQDRWTQKLSLEEAGLPTSPFIRVDSFEQAEQIIENIDDKMVFKKRRFGYDGYGTFVVKNKNDLKKLKPAFKEAKDGFIAEQFCPFERELAITAVRNRDGQIIFLPLVESFQEDSRCLWVKGPMTHGSLGSLQKKIKKYLDQLDYVGCITFELFDLRTQLMINEIAPRVHNSAHYSLNALSIDQFSLHLLSLTKEDLHNPEVLHCGFAMHNLLGSGKSKLHLPHKKDIFVHWYGKKESRLGRKMGHLNSVDNTPKAALTRLRRAIKEYKL